MENKDETSEMDASALIFITPIIIFLAYLVLWNDHVRMVFGLGDMGPTGDFVAGIAAPFIGFLSATLVYLSFQQQVKANKIQIQALNYEREARKGEAKLARYKNIVSLMRSEIIELAYKRKIDREEKYTGMQAYEVFTADLVNHGDTPLKSNRNILDTILGLTIMLKITMLEAEKENEPILKEALDDLFMFYTVKLGKGLNTLEKVSWNDIIKTIKNNKNDVEEIFYKHGYLSDKNE